MDGPLKVCNGSIRAFRRARRFSSWSASGADLGPAGQVEALAAIAPAGWEQKVRTTRGRGRLLLEGEARLFLRMLCRLRILDQCP